MTIHIDSAIIHDAVRDAVAAHLAEHPIVMPATTPSTQENGPRYYSRKEAAAVAKVSVVTLHKLHNEGLVEFVKIGRSTRIKADKFDADLSAGRFSNNRHRRGL